MRAAAQLTNDHCRDSQSTLTALTSNHSGQLRCPGHWTGTALCGMPIGSRGERGSMMMKRLLFSLLRYGD